MKSLLRISLPCLLLAVLTVAQPAPPTSEPAPIAGWTIEETMKVRLVGYVRIAPGGKRVLYTVRTAILEGDKGSYPVTELAARGFAVLQCNSRGGTLPGYGPAAALPFTRPKQKGQPDVLAGVDHLVRIGVADGDRLGLTGLSNGGLVTAWIITQTRRFRAAIIDAGLPDLAGLTGQHAWISHDLAAEPWENLQPYREHSPLLHIGGVATPTLILHGDRDQVVPISQGLNWFRALQRRGVPTEMVVYPGEGHPVIAPRHLIDIGRRHVEWMTKHLR